MKTKITPLLTITLVLALPLLMGAQSRRPRLSTNVNVDRGNVTDCRDLRVQFDRRPAITEETEMILPPSQVSALRAQTDNSGIYVSGWDRNESSVKTCKAVPDSDPNASATLREINTTNTNGQLSVTGPRDREWVANLIIMVPRLSTLDLQTRNGPLQLRDLAGNIHLSASNGPISLANVGGSVQAATTNGPISVKGGSGDQQLSATNGPIRVGLSGTRWDGPGLQVSTRNGPLALSIPETYDSGIAIQVSGRSPVSCTAGACSGAIRSPGSPNIIRIGNGDPIVRLSTMNGPLSVRNDN